MTSEENKFTDADLFYYRSHYLNEDIEFVEIQEETNILKNVVAGMAVAILLWMIFWGIRYLMDNKIHTKEEIEERYDLLVIGHIKVKEKRKLYSIWKKYSFDTEEYLKYTLSTIGEKGVVVSGYYDNKSDSENICYTTGYLWKNQQVMEKAKEVGHVVICIHILLNWL